VEDELIRVCALTARVACQRMTPRHLKALGDSVEQACGMSTRYCWDRKATAHAEIVNHLADAAGGSGGPVWSVRFEDAVDGGG
jgi:hypothetical protein